MHAEVQRLIAESTSERGALQAEARMLAARIDELQEQHAKRPAIDEKALRESIDAEWSKKFQKIVTELTMDHENDIGDSIAAREAARAEARALNLRVQDLEKQVQSARDGRLGLLQRDDELTQRLARLEQDNATLRAQLGGSRPAALDEKALREKIEAEWSEKLQTIVSHIASQLAVLGNWRPQRDSVGSGTVAVSVTPRDRFGNYLGPGYASIKAKLTGAGKLRSEVSTDRDQTGTYVFTVADVTPGETPYLTITVDGADVGNPRRR